MSTWTRAFPVVSWTTGNADELQLASLRSVATLQGPVTMWVVRHGNDLFVRSMNGPEGVWYRAAQMRHQGNIRAGGVQKEVTFADASRDLSDQIDAAYRNKYRRYGANYVDSIVSPEARRATIKLVPR